MSSTDAGRRTWLNEIRRLGSAGCPSADIVVSVARRLDPSFPERGLRLQGRWVGVPPLPPDSGPELLGQAYECLIGRADRHRAGIHYTPLGVARRLSEIAIDGLIDESIDVCDPACGGGAFLLASAEVLEAGGFDRREIVARRLWGIDLDPLAIAVAEAALYLWSGAVAADHLVTADAVTDPWPATGLAVVVGNPPFQSQLGESTVRSRPMAARLRDRYGELVGPYTDTAWVFLAAAAAAVRPGGRVVLVQPQSVLSARDAAGIRRRVTLEGLWLSEEPVFSASVRVCAPVVRVGQRPHRTVQRWKGSAVTALEPVVRPVGDRDGEHDDAWADLGAGILGIPELTLDSKRRLGDLATATAGFRDQFYGLAGFVVDGGDARWPKLVTSGIIEPGRAAWGERPLRFAGRSWLEPRVDVTALRARGRRNVARWVDDRLVPKVVVATQSRVIEAAVDVDGTWVPSTPVISVTAAADRLDHVAAVLLGPPATVWALRRFAGAALATAAVKLAARQVLDVPIPPEGPDWDAAAHLLRDLPSLDDPASRRAALIATGERMIAAYGIDRTGDGLLEWWAARLRA